MESGATAYGASLAGGAFDFVKFAKQPQTIVRFLSWVFAIVVFSCITAEGYVNHPDQSIAHCIFNQNDSACHYAVGVGVIAFLLAAAFLFLHAYLPLMSNASERKYVVLADLVLSGAWTFLWFVCFCNLANQWSKTTETMVIPADAARAAIAFSFFSIATWGALTYFAVLRYRQGVDDIAQNYADPAPEQSTPYPPTYAPSYPPYPTGGPENYQQPSFTPTPPQQGEDGYQPPVY